MSKEFGHSPEFEKMYAEQRTQAKPVNGTCCSCGDSAPEETPCPKREEGTHCMHWWDGPDE